MKSAGRGLSGEAPRRDILVNATRPRLVGTGAPRPWFDDLSGACHIPTAKPPMTGTVMNRIQQIRRRAGPARRTDPAFAAWLEQAPAAAARQVVGSVYKVPVHTVMIGGLPGWRNALLAARGGTCRGHTGGAVSRARAARRKTITAAA